MGEAPQWRWSATECSTLGGGGGWTTKNESESELKPLKGRDTRIVGASAHPDVRARRRRCVDTRGCGLAVVGLSFATVFLFFILFLFLLLELSQLSKQKFLVFLPLDIHKLFPFLHFQVIFLCESPDCLLEKNYLKFPLGKDLTLTNFLSIKIIFILYPNSPLQLRFLVE